MSFYAYGGKVDCKNEVLRKLNDGFVWIFDYETKRDKYVELKDDLNVIKPWTALKFMHNFNVEFAGKYMEKSSQEYARLCEVTHIESMYEYIIRRQLGLEVHIISEWEPDF